MPPEASGFVSKTANFQLPTALLILHPSSFIPHPSLVTPRPIYLDSHSTTPLDPRVLDAMLPFLRESFGNAASVNHPYGWEAKDAVDAARETVAQAIGAEPREIVFTSGATESVNLAIKGALEAAGDGPRHVVTCATEHRAVLDTCRRLERRGVETTVLPVRDDGTLDYAELAAAIRPETALVSLMHANNEIGVIHDIAAVGALCAERGVLLHVDAAQSLGKIDVDARAMGAHLLSFSGHKFHGPKGVGGLYVRRSNPRVKLAAQMDGGGHERAMRSGTLNVPGIVGMARALGIAVEERAADAARTRWLRDLLRDRIAVDTRDVHENGAREPRLAHSLNLAFQGVDSVALLNAVPEIAVSTGSACSSADPDPSHVIMALGPGPFASAEERARCSVRFGLSRFTTEEEVERAAFLVIAAVRRLRAHAA